MRAYKRLLSLALLLGCSVLAVGVPNTVNYQGRLTDAAGDPVSDGPYLVKFQIYDAATGGTVLWNSGFQTVNTKDGTFSYELGSNVTLPVDLFLNDSSRWLGITVGTDPEISPRTRFLSTGYTYQASQSDTAWLARDADSLGGLQPSFYRDWNNLNNVPAGFADGVDDEGISQAAADARYVNETGDVMTGVYDMRDGSGNSTLLFRPHVAEIDAFYPNGFNSFAGLIARQSRGGWLILTDTLGNWNVQLQGKDDGDNSVIFPNSAINSVEMFDEPGLAKGVSTAHITLTTTMQDIATVTITTPGPGYIFVTGRCWAQMNRDTTLSSGQLSFQIDETAGGSNLQSQSVFPSFSTPSRTTQQSVYVDRAYFKSAAGTYTFRLEGFRFIATGGVMRAGNGSVTAMYFPTSYGSVSTVAEQPGDHPDAKRVEMVGPDGRNVTGYKMDLRYYEEKARAARIAEQKAELARAEAELELARAKAAGDK